MDFMKKVAAWFVYSSQNPEKISRTLKSVAAFAVLFGVDTSVVDEGIGHIVSVIAGIGMLVSAGSGAWFFALKLKNTMKLS